MSNTKKLIESNKSSDEIVGKLSEEELTQPAETGFALKFLKNRGYYFKWVDGRNNGMFFYPEHIEDDEHVRGSYENHPRFGNIRSDVHQIYDIVSGIEQNVVRVFDKNQNDVTRKAERYVDVFYQETEGSY